MSCIGFLIGLQTEEYAPCAGFKDNPGVKETVEQMKTIMNTPEQRQFVWDRKLAMKSDIPDFIPENIVGSWETGSLLFGELLDTGTKKTIPFFAEKVGTEAK